MIPCDGPAPVPPFAQTITMGAEMQKVAVITAGGSGMGAAAARRLAADGFAVAILSSSGKGEALASELGGVGITGSNQSNDDVQRLVDATMARFGRIDVLVNSAGHGPRAALLDITDEGWHQGIDIYFLSAVRPIRAVTPIFEAQGTGGSIINITTFATFEPDPAFPTSGVARAGLAAFTKLYADKYAPQGIRINNLLPGFINSLPEKEEFRTRIPRFHPENWPHNKAKLDAFHAYARTRGLTPAALALAWLLDRAPHILPIPGTRTADHLRAWVTAPEIDLDDDDREEIDRLLPVGWAWGDRYDDLQAATVERYS